MVITSGQMDAEGVGPYPAQGLPQGTPKGRKKKAKMQTVKEGGKKVPAKKAKKK